MLDGWRQGVRFRVSLSGAAQTTQTQPGDGHYENELHFHNLSEVAGSTKYYRRQLSLKSECCTSVGFFISRQIFSR